MTIPPAWLLALNVTITAVQAQLVEVLEEHRTHVERCGPEVATAHLIADLRRCEPGRLACIAGVALSMLAQRQSP